MSWYDFIQHKFLGRNLISSNFINTTAQVFLRTPYGNIDIENTDIVGGIIQSWFSKWLLAENISHKLNGRTQTWPDLWVTNPLTHREFPLEIKAFKQRSSPAFDISDFNLYLASIENDPKKLDCDYLIFEYSLINGCITITNCWWRKVWEIVGKTNQGLVTLQTRKRGGVIVPNNLRPYKFFSSQAKNSPIKNCLEFVRLLQVTASKYDQNFPCDWAQEIADKYCSITGQPLK